MTPMELTATQAKAKLLARLGGLHRPPNVADDRTITAEEPAVEMMRDLPAAKTESTTEF